LRQNPALGADGRLGNITERDAVFPYMYLPPLPGFIEHESVVCFFRLVTLSDDQLAGRRVAQLSPLARRHLQYKLAMYWGRIRVPIDRFRLGERNEDALKSDSDPPSPSYDAASRYAR
jgi:hypothetical protein